MRYVEARIEQEQRDLMYRIYVTDALQAMPQDRYLVQRYADFAVEKNVQEDTRTGDEIAEEIIKKAGLKLGIEL